MGNFTVIENTDESMDKFGHCYGSDIFKVNKKDIQALLDGKVLAATVNFNEYSIFVKLKED
jgi:hypothetical protein